MARLAIAFLFTTILAGCVGGNTTEGSGPVETASGDPTPADADRSGEARAASTPSAPVPLALALDGTTGNQAIACVMDPVGECIVEGTPGESDLLFDGLAVAVIGGNATLEWEPASPATEELSVGVMLMGGQGSECAPMVLAGAQGPAPLAIEVGPSDRAICPGEILHVWVSGTLYHEGGAVYAQLDLEQPFRLVGNVLLSPSEGEGR